MSRPSRRPGGTPAVLYRPAEIGPDFEPSGSGPPTGALLCPPDAFEVRDAKNPFMEGRAGTVDRGRARDQWDGLVDALHRLGLAVEVIEPLPACEDMVFCANPTLTGRDAHGALRCIASRMRFPSRAAEVAAACDWLQARGYAITEATCPFEGGGDAVWHPRRALAWVASGPRSAPEAARLVADTFGVPVVALTLSGETFYHLDTCFCPLDERTVLAFPPGLDPRSMELVRAVFPRVVEATESEARVHFACNAVALDGAVLLPAGNDGLAVRLRALGYDVTLVDTGEFLKSGGSAFCMKQWLW